jgi:hypothetical protein
MSSHPGAPNNYQRRWAAYCCGVPPSVSGEGRHPEAERPPPAAPRCGACFDNYAAAGGLGLCHVCAFRRRP